jgi:hypothetical protein
MRAFVVDEPRVGALRALNYAPAVERIRRAGSDSAKPLGEILKAFGPAYGTVFTRLDCSPDHGIELITQGDMFAAEPSGRVIRLDSMRNPERHLVTRGQVLIAGAGTLGENELYGRSILADGRLAGKYVGPHSMSLHFEDPDADFSLFTYAWLASPTGVQALRSTSYGTKILGLRKDLLSTLPVPVADRATMKRVAALIRRSVSGREDYARAIVASRRLVESIPDVAEALEACRYRRRRSVVWDAALPSLCAWNFAAAGGALPELRRKWSTRLADVVQSRGIFLGPRTARVGCAAPHGVQLLSQRDVFMIRPVGQRVARSGIADRLIHVPEDSLLVAANGQMNEGSLFGKIELASIFSRETGITGHIMRILPRSGQREAIYGFLSTSVGQLLMKSTAVGTSVPSMRTDLLASLPFPDPGLLPLAELREFVRRAEVARIDAQEAESEAIRIIEEEVLPQWLA